MEFLLTLAAGIVVGILLTVFVPKVMAWGQKTKGQIEDKMDD